MPSVVPPHPRPPQGDEKSGVLLYQRFFCLPLDCLGRGICLSHSGSGTQVGRQGNTVQAVRALASGRYTDQLLIFIGALFPDK